MIYNGRYIPDYIRLTSPDEAREEAWKTKKEKINEFDRKILNEIAERAQQRKGA